MFTGFVLNSDDEGRASILVTNQLFQSMGVTPEQLHADAMENAPQIYMYQKKIICDKKSYRDMPGDRKAHRVSVI